MRARFTLSALAVIGLVLASCGGSSEPFDFATDDLCERVSAEQVSEIVEEAYREHGATPVPGDYQANWVSDAYVGCSWEVPGVSAVGLVGVSPDRAAREEAGVSTVYEPHLGLSDGVGVSGSLEVGSHDDWVPGLQVRVSADGQEWTVEFWHQVPPGFDGDAEALLAIADGLLGEMGWIPSS